MSTKKPGGSVLNGFLLSTFGTLAWQAMLLAAAAFAASSHFVAAHTRHQQKLALILWLGGVMLNLGTLYWALRRAKQSTRDGILAGVCLLFLLVFIAIWFINAVHSIHTDLGDD